MMRMTMASGGGGDNTISFYNNGSTGAHWNASDGSQWSVTNQSGALTVGEVRYTTFFTPRLITSQYFSVGCNDGETMNVAVDRCLPPPNGTITANPNPCQISPIASTCLPGLCCNSAISWSTNNTPSAVVCVDTGSGEILFASNTSGMQNASWIQTGTNYLFRLRTGNTCGSGTLLRSVTVTALPALTCSVTLSPPSLALTQGETGTVVANVLISDGSSPNSSVLRTTFSSDNLLVATLNPVQVTPPGYSTTVTAVGPGSAAISAVVNLLNGNSCSTPTSTAVNVTPPEPWYQTQSGDVHAQGNITSKIPGTILAPNNVFSKDLYSFPGVISFGGASAYFGMGTVSSKGWLANSPFIPTNTSYSYFFSKLGSPTVESFTDGNGRKYCDDVACPGGQSTTQTTIYYAKSRDVNISAGRQWNNIPVGAKIIVLVDGNLNISMNTNGRIIVPVGSFLAFFVKGNIYLEGNMGNKSVSTTPILDGIYMADGIIDTYYPAPSGPGLGSGFRMITGGLFYGGSGVLLNRDIKNDCSLGAICNANTPSEYFGFRPDLVVNTPRELWSGSMSWLEVIP
ncbi:MAG: hypothetical protein Q7S03_03845 [bacterium]|nr:hypothetical protein [bacterium]